MDAVFDWEADSAWRQRIADYLAACDKVLLLPERDTSWNAMLVRAFLADCQCAGERCEVWSLTALEDVPCRVLSEQEMRAVVRLYQMYAFTDKLVIGSLCVPCGRLWENLVSSGCIGREELAQIMTA